MALEVDSVKRELEKNNVSVPNTVQEIASLSKTKEIIDAEIDKFNRELPTFEQIKYTILAPLCKEDKSWAKKIN